MSIKELITKLFNVVIIKKEEYEELTKIEDIEKHNSYIKYWICVAECKEAIINIGYSYYTVKPENIAGDRLFYTRTDENGTIIKDDINLEQVSIPEQYKADFLGTYYDPTDKFQTEVKRSQYQINIKNLLNNMN